MKNIFKSFIYVISFSVVVSCHDDLNQSPIDPDSFTEENVFATVNDAKGALAKLYASLALTGQTGPAGNADIAEIDEGFSQFSRMLFNLNEITIVTNIQHETNVNESKRRIKLPRADVVEELAGQFRALIRGR